MAALAIDRAPEASLPLDFLRMSPVWGLMAAALLLQQGELLFASRWASATIAFVHAFTLGVVGNAMLGSLLQFLPVVADTQPHLGRFGRGLAIAYNLGLLTLIAGLLRWPMLLAPSGLVLATVLTIFALGTLAGIRFDGKQSLLRAGLALSLLMLLTTAILGMVLTLALAGWIAVPLPMLSDIHAATGVLGGGVLLAASVGSVVLPMFQGTRRVPGKWLAIWMAGHLGALVLALALRWTERPGAMSVMLALQLAAFAAGTLALQAHATKKRNPTLVRFWRLGSVALLLAAILAVAVPLLSKANLNAIIGVLVVAIGLPALVLGMGLEINAFLAWLQLQDARQRGQRVPSVDVLLPEQTKSRLLWLHLIAAVALVLAAAWSHAINARLAGALLALAYAATTFELFALRRRTQRLILGLQHTPTEAKTK